MPGIVQLFPAFFLQNFTKIYPPENFNRFLLWTTLNSDKFY